MEQTFLTGIDIVKVRHLENISIPLSKECRKHLLLTGKNGSGKTSVLDAIAYNLCRIEYADSQYLGTERGIENVGTVLHCTAKDFIEKYWSNQFILAYYRTERQLNMEISDTIERIQVQERYAMKDNPGSKLIKYMVGLKATQALAYQQGKQQRADEIEAWFQRFEGILKQVFEDPALKLDFDIETFQFSILQTNREPFDFNMMSSGYSAVFDIINDLTMRMEKKGSDVEGIVLIDEIETHLYLELQKMILPFLTQLFPKIQFIVSTHSPFVLSSIENAVIYDLETKTLVEDSLTALPYEGIVEGYFRTDHLLK